MCAYYIQQTYQNVLLNDIEEVFQSVMKGKIQIYIGITMRYSQKR